MLHFPRWKSLLIIGSVVLAIILALPNAFPQAVRDRIPLLRNLTPMVLGLDLQGGSHLLLEVDRADLESQLSKQLIGDIRQTLREQKVRYCGTGTIWRRRQRPHHRGCRPRPGVHGAAETVAAGQHGTVRRWAYVARVRRVAERRDCRVPVHAGRPRRQDQPRHPAVAGNPRPAHQRFRNDRADRAEARRGPYPHPGSRDCRIQAD